jgi:glycosyltransferase involved in cell wall biosynthesis
MRVLVLHSRYLSGSVSGENRVVEDQETLLRRGGFDVQVWAPSADGVSLVRAGMNTLWSERSVEAVRALIDAFDADVVHVHNMFPMLSPAVLRGAARRAAVVLTLHNFRLACLPGTLYRDGRVCEDCVGRDPWPGVIHACYRDSVAASGVLATSLALHRRIATYDHVHRFTTVSRFMRDRLADAGLPSERTDVITNFCAPTERRMGAGEHFLYLGRLSPEKGLEHLVTAWRGVDARLVVVGEGPERSNLEAMAPSSVEFRGAVPGSAVPDLLRRARAVLVPSRWYEGAPRVIIEAYAAGVPVLASSIGSVVELVADGETGYLVEVGDASAWRRAAEDLLDYDVSERLGAGAFDRWTARHTPEIALEELRATYERAIAAAADR